MTNSLKVKDNKNLAYLFLPLCMAPLVFIFVFEKFDEKLVALLVTLLVFVLYFAWLFHDMIKKQDVYAIVADSEGVSFKKFGHFKWVQISSIEVFTKTVHRGRHFFAERYIKIKLADESCFDIETSDFDVPYEDIALILRKLGNLS